MFVRRPSVLPRPTAAEPLESRRSLSATPISPDPLDPAFGGGDGIVTGAPVGSFNDIVALADGRFLVAESNSSGASLARFNADGTPDTTFGSGGQVIAASVPFLSRVALQPDGKIVGRDQVLARFLPDGAPDPTFGGGDGVVPLSANGDGLGLQPDGKILVTEGDTVSRYKADGSLDTAFATGGHFNFNIPIGSVDPADPIAEPYDGFLPLDVAYQPSSGEIVVGGQTTGPVDFGLAQLTLDGRLDTGFGADGLRASDANLDAGGRIALGPTGAIYMAGTADGGHDPVLVIFDDANGLSAGNAHLPYVGPTADVAVGPDGSVYVVGDAEYSESSGLFDIAVVRFRPADESFVTFTTDVLRTSHGHAFGVTVAPGGDVVVAGAAGETPVLLRYDAAAFDVPQVRQVSVRGTEWSRPGVRLFDGDEPRFLDQPLPFVNLNQFTFQFDRPVNVTRDDLIVRGVNLPSYTIADFRYDPDTRTAVWTLAAPIGADKLRLELNPAKFGPGAAARLNVLPGDVDQDGAVVAADASAVKRSFFRSVENPGAGADAYSIYRDVNGSGSILADDFSAVKARFFTRLPAAEPVALPITAQGAAPARPRPTTRALFATSPVLA